MAVERKKFESVESSLHREHPLVIRRGILETTLAAADPSIRRLTSYELARGARNAHERRE
jgi:hypothetical protein